jgi:hypothetical protein
MIEVDKILMGGNLYREERAEERGLVQVYAYHCYRCNYTWLPRDFDFCWNYYKTGWWGDDLFYREPPKSCARCKSRSWKHKFSYIKQRKDGRFHRKLKLHPTFEGEDWIDEDKINDITSGYHQPYMQNLARLRALERQGKLTYEDVTQYWKEFRPPKEDLSKVKES